MPRKFAFGRKEKLKSRKAIEELFLQGESFSVFPLRLIFRTVQAGEGSIALQMGVTVSKKHFKSAVKRNRIKRLIREAYRLQKHDLADSLNMHRLQMHVFIMFTGKDMPRFTEIQQIMAKGLEQLKNRVEKNAKTV